MIRTQILKVEALVAPRNESSGDSTAKKGTKNDKAHPFRPNSSFTFAGRQSSVSSRIVTNFEVA
jgi:hypothetical protein